MPKKASQKAVDELLEEIEKNAEKFAKANNLDDVDLDDDGELDDSFEDLDEARGDSEAAEEEKDEDEEEEGEEIAKSVLDAKGMYKLLQGMQRQYESILKGQKAMDAKYDQLAKSFQEQSASTLRLAKAANGQLLPKSAKKRSVSVPTAAPDGNEATEESKEVQFFKKAQAVLTSGDLNFDQAILFERHFRSGGEAAVKENIPNIYEIIKKEAK